MSSKGKGSSFEREIAVKLSLWWSEGKRDDVFFRSSNSGGRFTVRNKVNKDTFLGSGDIVASDPSGKPLMDKWSIEAKTGYGVSTDKGIIRWDILDFIDSRQKEPVLQKMWNQCKRDANLTHRNPILIFRRNGRSPCIMIDWQYYTKLCNFFGAFYGDYIILNTGNFFCFVTPLDYFFEWIPNIRGILC